MLIEHGVIFPPNRTTKKLFDDPLGRFNLKPFLKGIQVCIGLISIVIHPNS